MKYIMLLWPHANARYRTETRRLALAEAELMLSRVCPEAAVTEAALNDLPALGIQAPEDADLSALKAHSLMYGLFRMEGEAMYPALGREVPMLGEDLPGVLKYKGKTNELFTHMLVNAALYTSDFYAEKNVQLYDPMCGKGTTLFDGVNRGWMCTGSDIDKNDLREAEQFFKRYLEFHRFKHSLTKSGLTRPGGKNTPCASFALPTLPGAGLRLAECDAAQVRETFGKKKAQLVVTDLPYGVQHSAAGGGTVEGLLRRALPDWRELLKEGGAAAVSFNAQTLPRKKVIAAMRDAGYTVPEEGPYARFEHWVEQAVTRDIVVGVRRDEQI